MAFPIIKKSGKVYIGMMPTPYTTFEKALEMMYTILGKYTIVFHQLVPEIFDEYGYEKIYITIKQTPCGTILQARPMILPLCGIMYFNMNKTTMPTWAKTRRQ